VGDDLIGGPGCTSEFDPATPLPVLNNDQGAKFVTLVGASGDDETDVIDETVSARAELGQTVVLQQFTITDPGPNGDAESDGSPTLVRAVTVRLDVGEDRIKIKRLRLFRESARTKPGWQEQDELLATIVNPRLEDLTGPGVTFSQGGRVLLLVPDNFRERLYVVADLAPDGFRDEDADGRIFLRASVEVLARDDLAELPDDEDDGCLFVCNLKDGTSSGIETPQPVDARGELIILIPAPKVLISQLDLTRTGKVTVSISDMPGTGLARFTGTFAFDPGLVRVRQTAQGTLRVKALGPYNVLITSDVSDMETLGIVGFELTLKNGSGKRQPLTKGAVLEIEMELAPTDEIQSLLCEVSELSIIDDPTPIALEDPDGEPIADPDIVEGRARVNLRGGDVDLNGVVNRADIRWVSLFILRKLDPATDLGVNQEIFEKAADVAPPFGQIDATDVRHIKEAAIRRRTLESACDNPIERIPAHTALAGLRAKAVLSDPSWSPLRVTSTSASIHPADETVEFAVAGSAIASIEVRLYSLSGALLFHKAAAAPRLQLDLRAAGVPRPANGVYFYVITARGFDGETLRSRIQKFSLVR
jgi:hypothetical protein